MPNAFAHIELTTRDLKQAKQFYKKLFDWQLTDMPMGEGPPYTMIAAGKGPGGGMQAQPMANAPITWLPYVEVDDVAASLVKATKAGAKVMLPAMDIGKNGIIGIFSDPAGAALGLWSSTKAPAKAAKPAAKPAKTPTKSAKPAAKPAKPAAKPAKPAAKPAKPAAKPAKPAAKPAKKTAKKGR